MTSYRTRIQNKLKTLAEALDGFHEVTYDVDGLAEVGSSVVPESSFANEIRSTFADASRNRRTMALDRESWMFDLLVAFPKEVTGEAFERTLQEDPPILARDSNHDQQVTIKLREIFPEHPPQQDSENGSRVRYVFEAIMSPL